MCERWYWSRCGRLGAGRAWQAGRRVGGEAHLDDWLGGMRIGCVFAQELDSCSGHPLIILSIQPLRERAAKYERR
jgi:hypothetical protein